MGNSNSLKAHLENTQKTGICALPKRSLTELPPDLVKVASHLRSLDVSQNKLVELPVSMQAFSNLKHINCQQNKLRSVPESLCQLQKLESLNLSNNCLTSLPASLGSLKSLKIINLSRNQLTVLPEGLCTLPHLDVADLSNNGITTVPDYIGTLTCSELNLNENQINHLSDELSRCSRLRTLRLESNCLEVNSVPASLFTESAVSLLLLDGNVFGQKQLADRHGYSEYMKRYTATKMKMN